MRKVALLVGVSEYEAAFTALPGARHDLEAVEQVLTQAEMGGFDHVQVLLNPSSLKLRLAIEKLFADSRSQDDLVLLYFSGHGVRNEQGTLFFVSHDTQLNEQQRIYEATAVPATFLQEWMTRSRSHRQVVILDCCFSGAFAQGMTARKATLVPEDIDIVGQLGGEGRAVLTASTATQLSYENAAGGVYTQYLVEGIRTGAADTDNDGVITTDELHQYAKRKTQEAKPAMQPEIYAVREGYRIRLAKAPIGDPLVEYRKEVENCLRDGAISATGRRILRRRQTELKITIEQANAIEADVFAPIREYQQSLQEYQEAVQEAWEEAIAKQSNRLSEEDWLELKRYQQMLKLRDEDVAAIECSILEAIEAEQNQQQPQTTPPAQPPQAATVVNTTAETNSTPADDLSSEKGIDYTKLRDLLKAGQWQEADRETYEVMIRAVGKKSGDYFREEELLNFPCADLKTIDRLWVKYSQGKFGFSVQKQIYVECGAKLDGKYPGDKIWYKFCDRVGWRVNDKWNFSNLKNNPQNSPAGELPGWVWGGVWLVGLVGWGSLLSHRDL